VPETVRVTLHWRDRDGGSSTQESVGGYGAISAFNGRFTRLDG